MTLKNRFPLIVLLLLLAGLLAIALAPFTVSNGLRLWVWWKSRQEGLIVSIDKIDAPFLQPVVIRNLHLKSARPDVRLGRGAGKLAIERKDVDHDPLGIAPRRIVSQ